MYLGKIMEIGPADKVINRPHNPYTKALVSIAKTPTPPAAGRVRPDDPRRRDARRGPHPDRVPVPPALPTGFDRCRVEEPPLFDVGDGQSAACWLVEGGRSLPVMPATAAP